MSVPGTRFVVDTDGKKAAVLLSVQQYEKLLEDLHDLAVIAARRDEAPMTFEDIKQRLKSDRLRTVRERSLVPAEGLEPTT